MKTKFTAKITEFKSLLIKYEGRTIVTVYDDGSLWIYEQGLNLEKLTIIHTLASEFLNNNLKLKK